MPIEFRCETCGKLLRTGAENSGRAARCPGCGETLSVPASRAGAERPASGSGPVDAPIRPEMAVAPHRGGPILVLGILSWAMTCFLFGIPAWAMGAQDLQAMRAGEMDPSGESMTRAGMYLGMANVALWILSLLGMIALGGLAIVFG